MGQSIYIIREGRGCLEEGMLVKKNNMRRGRGDYQEELRIFVTGREADENGGGGAKGRKAEVSTISYRRDAEVKRQ